MRALEKTYPILYRLLVIVFIVQLVFAVGIYFSFHDWPSRGQFGDMFGALNTSFSGFAMAGMIYVSLLQQKALQDQNKMQQMMQKEILKQSHYALLGNRINALQCLIEVYHSLDLNKKDFNTSAGIKMDSKKLVQENIESLERLLAELDEWDKSKEYDLSKK